MADRENERHKQMKLQTLGNNRAMMRERPELCESRTPRNHTLRGASRTAVAIVLASVRGKSAKRAAGFESLPSLTNYVAAGHTPGQAFTSTTRPCGAPCLDQRTR